jgi:hypothetical protein
MISKIVPFLLVVAGFYILFRVYSTFDKFDLQERGVESEALIESKAPDGESLSYSYRVAGKTYLVNERVDENIYNNNVIGEKIIVLVDNENPQKSLIKDNKTALSYISFSRKSNTNPVVLRPWIGLIIGLSVIGLGLWRIIRIYRKSRVI